MTKSDKKPSAKKPFVGRGKKLADAHKEPSARAARGDTKRSRAADRPVNRIAEHVTPEPPAPAESDRGEVWEMIHEKSDLHVEVLHRRQPFVSYVLDIERSMSSRRDMTLEDFIQEELEDFRAEDGEHIAIWRGTEILAVVRPTPDGRAEVIRLDRDDPSRSAVFVPATGDSALFRRDLEAHEKVLGVKRGGPRREFTLWCGTSKVDSYSGHGLTVADIAADMPFSDDEDDKGPMKLTYHITEGHDIVGVLVVRRFRPTVYFDLEAALRGEAPPAPPAPSRPTRAIPLEINCVSYATPITPGLVVRKSMTFHLEDHNAAPVTIQAVVMSEATAWKHKANLAELDPELDEAGWSRETILGNEVFTRLIV